MQTIAVQVIDGADKPNVAPPLRWVHRLAQSVAAFTFLLIFFGGHVTTINAGDTEPSWSLRFWDWFANISQLEGGHFYEITHRQIGTIVGFLAIGLVIALWRVERRAWVRRLGYIAFGLIFVQGLLGGLRVLVVSDPSVQETTMQVVGLADAFSVRVLSGMIHATLGLSIFSLMVGLAAVTSPRWFAEPVVVEPVRMRIYRRMGIMTICMLLIQIVLGTYLRHAGWHVLALLAHAMGGLLSALFAVLLTMLALSLPGDEPLIRRPAWILSIIVLCQVVLGLYSWAYPVAIWVRTAHHLVGGLLFALCIVITLRAHRLVAPGDVTGTVPHRSA